MRIEAGPLLDAIDRYIAKADKDLEETLEDEGYVAAKDSVVYINAIENELIAILGGNADRLTEAARDAETVEGFIAETWQVIKGDTELPEALERLFLGKFAEMMREFTREWLVKEVPVLADVAEDMTKSGEAFVMDWSQELADKMNLSTKEQMEGLLIKAVKHKWSIEKLQQGIEESGIRQCGYRARRVAVTETLRLQSYAQQESMVQNPLCYKKRWRHVMSGNPRENHRAIDGQEVFKRECFELPGRDGGVYRVMCPRDTSLPASETVNCHCLMESVQDENALGMSKEELSELRRKAMEEVNAEYEAAHATDTVDRIKGMAYEEQVRYFGGKDGGKQRLALITSGVISTDKKLERLYKTGEGGKREQKSLQELADDGIFTVSDSALRHSTVGGFFWVEES